MHSLIFQISRSSAFEYFAKGHLDVRSKVLDYAEGGTGDAADAVKITKRAIFVEKGDIDSSRTVKAYSCEDGCEG